ncbi:MAG: 30S ribosomal protein S6 [Candidatus Cloacimonetes bacterium]|nr:30S ribosomal protein S6 [Candidatus Cloacimonadota bacterium]
MKKKYESMLIIHSASDEDVAKTIETVKQFIMDKDGEIIEVKEWGKRKFAYEINHIDEGYYFILYFKLDATHIYSLEKLYKLNENIIRFIVIKRDKE